MISECASPVVSLLLSNSSYLPDFIIPRNGLYTYAKIISFLFVFLDTLLEKLQNICSPTYRTTPHILGLSLFEKKSLIGFN